MDEGGAVLPLVALIKRFRLDSGYALLIQFQVNETALVDRERKAQELPLFLGKRGRLLQSQGCLLGVGRRMPCSAGAVPLSSACVLVGQNCSD